MGFSHSNCIISFHSLKKTFCTRDKKKWKNGAITEHAGFADSKVPTAFLFVWKKEEKHWFDHFSIPTCIYM